MSAINELREGLAHTETAQFVTTMLRDISATRLQSIRASYDANKKYYIELHGLMTMLQAYAVDKGIVLPADNKKKILVAVTSNRRFYGTLNSEVVSKLLQTISKESEYKTDCLVIGQTGQQILQRQDTSAPVQFFSFEKDKPTTEEISEVVSQLVAYDEVQVVHPTYINAFEQTAKITDVTHIPDSSESVGRKSVEYLFEPDVPAMLEFFKTQIRLVLFGRIVLETRLALTGARLMKMQRARERTEEMLTDERRVMHKEISTMQSMRLLETFTGFRNENAL